MAHLRNCVLCGKVYDYCPRCDATEPTYKLKYCSENCEKVALVMNKYAFKHMTQEEAAMELLKLNVELEKYNEHNQEYLKNILDVMKKPEPMPEPVIEEEKPVEKKVVTTKKPLRRNTKIVNDN